MHAAQDCERPARNQRCEMARAHLHLAAAGQYALHHQAKIA